MLHETANHPRESDPEDEPADGERSEPHCALPMCWVAEVDGHNKVAERQEGRRHSNDESNPTHSTAHTLGGRRVARVHLMHDKRLLPQKPSNHPQEYRPEDEAADGEHNSPGADTFIKQGRSVLNAGLA